jgi:hypothetical protein
MQALGQGSLPVAGVQLLVDPGTAVSLFLLSDAWGGAAATFPVPQVPGYVGMQLFAQVGWLDPCGPQGIITSRGLQFAIRP